MPKINCEVWLVVFGVLVAVLLRACTTLHPYSGQGAAPMFGDYEAQRHWMEITTNLPVDEWYKQTEDNNLTYWGLDYPPLTAYHMYLCGMVAGALNANYTALHLSRGHESDDHKLFMRYTVLIVDILIYIPALIHYYVATKNFYVKNQKRDGRPLSTSLSIVLGLLYPGLILIDHGHFQYNCVSLGLMIFATTYLLKKQNIIASICFCLALNYKQMELYHALPFFIYLLSTCVPKPGQSTTSGLMKLTTIGTTVIVMFAIIWAPFFWKNSNTSVQVLQRLFPIARGIYEDKVANFWCFINLFYKIKFVDNDKMMRISLFVTLSALFPSSIDLFLRPNLRKFVLALINSSMAFFLFGYQVHEKSILLVAIPVLLYFSLEPFVCFWFICFSIFSMLPLLAKDDLIVATIALTLFYLISFRVSIEHFYRKYLNQSDGFVEYYRSLLHILLDIEYKKATPRAIIKLTVKQMIKNKDSLKVVLFHFVMFLSLFGCVVLSLISFVFLPPKIYPDLFPVLISAYSTVHFLGFFVYFNIKQIRIPQEFDDIKSVKFKMS